MTTTLREAAQQALEALGHVVRQAQENLVPTIQYGPVHDVMNNLRAALAQQTEPVLQTCNCRWDGDVQVQQCTLHEAHVDAIHEWAERAKVAERKLAQQAEPVQALNAWAEARLSRHGISACLYPNCVGGQSGTVCHQHCPTPCTDCRGLGYDSSGQLCACQQNPSF